MKKNTAQNSGRTAGPSRNPGGRPKKDIAAEIAQRVFEENADAIYKAMLKALLKGDPEVFAVLADRAYGKLTLKAEIPGMEDLAAEIARKVIVEYLRYLRGKPKGRRELMKVWPVESPAMKSSPVNT